MKKRDLAIALAVLAAFLAVRGRALFTPFILPFDTAFQESIALHHLENGLAANRFLSVFATIDGQNFYHTAHPPLLQIIYAGLYKAVGVHEWVTRFFSLGLWFGSALLWRALLRRDERHGWFVFPLAFALPLGFLLSTTTNYEHLSIFMVSLFAWMALVRGSGLGLLAPVLLVGLLVDWPVYLAVPALLMVKWSDRESRRKLAYLIVLEAVLFAALQFYQYHVAGEAAFFSHAPERANPLALFSLATWRELISHIISIMGPPLAILSFAIALACLFSLIHRGAGFQTRASDRASDLASSFFALFLLLLLLSAPSLVSRHEVYLLYFMPLLILASHRALARLPSPRLGLATLMILCLGRDFVLHQHRSPAYFGMADRLRNAGLKTAFASSAIGAWYYYDRIETIHPMSAAAARWVSENRPDLVHLDSRHAEVAGLEALGRGMKEAFAIPGERALVHSHINTDLRPAGTFIMAGPGRDCPGGAWIAASPAYGANMSACRITRFALAAAPGPGGSLMTWDLPASIRRIFIAPGLVHALPTARSDGAQFLAVSAGAPDRPRLKAARFVAGREPAGTLEIILAGSARLSLITLPGPRGDWAFDDAYWLEPRAVSDDNKNK